MSTERDVLMDGGALLALSSAAARSLVMSRSLEARRRWGPRAALLLLAPNTKGSEMLLGDLGSTFVGPLRARPAVGFSPL